MPIGTPSTIEISVHTAMIAIVDMVSFHMPKKPISTNATTMPTISFHERVSAQMTAATAMITAHQGAFTSSRSNHTRKTSKGSKKASISAPNSREKPR